MLTKRLFVFSFVLLTLVSFARFAAAEDKSASGEMIPKLQKTTNDPELLNNFVYPMWGPVCQRYTYTVIYRDKEGRPPQYMRIIFNGKPVDMEKADPNDSDYKKGVRYVYKFVPNKIGSNFYYFEASNGLGKARASIIDSPDNGPVLFEGDFLHNEIAVIDSRTGQKILSYPTGEEWVGGVALSDDGRYLAAKTSSHIYLFDLRSPQEPQWVYRHDVGGEIGGDLKGGVAISGDGAKIIASVANSVLLFNRSSNQLVWRYNMAGNAYNVAISKDGQYMAAATGGTESDVNTNLLILWNDQSEKPLWQYHASGNFHDVSLSSDGHYIAGSTGCPDRRYYLFSRESNNPLIRSEMLTDDSPVHRAKITADGSFSAVGSESGAGAVFLFSREANEPIWKFPTPSGSSVRALNFTPDGQYIGAATFGGQVYIFARSPNQPLVTWVFNAALGGIDIADDGSFVAVGGTDSQIHLLSQDKQLNIAVPFEEYVEEVDISANGKYVAAGTGGSVYFFETISQNPAAVSCTTVIEPRPLEEMVRGGLEVGEQIGSSDLGSPLPNVSGKLPEMVAVFGFFGSALALVMVIALRKLNFLGRPKAWLIGFSVVKLSFLRLTGRKVTLLLLALTVSFAILTVVAVVLNRNPKAVLLKQGEPAQPEPGRVIMNQQEKTQEGVCGNGLCEPGLGESRETCPKDCSAQ